MRTDLSIHTQIINGEMAVRLNTVYKGNIFGYEVVSYEEKDNGYVLECLVDDKLKYTLTVTSDTIVVELTGMVLRVHKGDFTNLMKILRVTLPML